MEGTNLFCLIGLMIHKRINPEVRIAIIMPIAALYDFKEGYKRAVKNPIIPTVYRKHSHNVAHIAV